MLALKTISRGSENGGRISLTHHISQLVNSHFHILYDGHFLPALHHEYWVNFSADVALVVGVEDLCWPSRSLACEARVRTRFHHCALIP
jgi:hypothetical protein